MTDDRVDELLKDLDAALSVQPSPAVAASVRTRIADSRAAWTMDWRPLAAAAAMVAVVAASYAAWPRRVPTPVAADRAGLTEDPPSDPSAVQSPTSIVQGPTSTVREPRVTVAAGRTVNRKVRVAASRQPVNTDRREPEVLVSSAVRLGFEQLLAAVAAGRITAESFTNNTVAFQLDVVEPTIVVIQPFAIDTVPVDAPRPEPGGFEPVGPIGRLPLPFTSPPSRTRSTV